MTLENVQKAIREGQAGFIKQPQPQPEQAQPKTDDFTKFIAILEVLRRPKYHVTTAPTFAPKTFLDQIQFYDDATNRRIYFYINGTWRYAALT
jgi:hypothetical protein